MEVLGEDEQRVGGKERGGVGEGFGFGEEEDGLRAANPDCSSLVLGRTGVRLEVVRDGLARLLAVRDESLRQRDLLLLALVAISSAGCR